MNVEGLNVVVTGKIAGETRVTAEAALRDRGAFVQSAVVGTTDLLVTGDAVGATKLNKASRLGVRVAAWAEVMNGAAPAEEPVEAVDRKKTPVARQIAPMLAQKSETIPNGDYVFEVKWDGYRCVAFVRGGEVTLASRSGLPLSFPKIASALSGLPDCILDGEVVVTDAEGRSSFQSLGENNPNAVYVAFDCVEAFGDDTRSLTLRERREVLDGLLEHAEAGRVQASPTFDDGDALLDVARAQGLEGIVAKRAASTYHDGSRSAEWLKIKIRNEQEFAVVGYTPGEGKTAGKVGALVLAVNVDGVLTYCGKVGTGWDVPELNRLTALVQALPAGDAVADADDQKDVVWVAPEVVVQVAFQRWTNDARLWHPSYQGQRIDKAVGDVVREQS